MTRLSELKPMFDSRKSFYGKATIEWDEKTITLISYWTRICTIDREGNIIKKYDHISSQTTTRHIKKFCKQFDIDYKEYCKA